MMWFVWGFCLLLAVLWLYAVAVWASLRYGQQEELYTSAHEGHECGPCDVDGYCHEIGKCWSEKGGDDE